MGFKKQYKTVTGKTTAPPQPMRAADSVGRNKPCPCGSGKKFKQCHGAPPAQVISSRPAQSVTLSHFYSEEQKAGDTAFRRQYGFAPNPTQLQVFMDGDVEETKRLVCEALRRLNAPPHFLQAVEKLNMLVTPMNHGLLTDEEKQAYSEALEEHRLVAEQSEQPAPADG